MKRKSLVTIHIVATTIAAITIATFFFSSLVAEINGEEAFIRTVKERILIALPVLLVAMPALGITGNKLAGKSQNAVVLAKKRRMRLVFANGLTLVFLACFLYYRSHYLSLDSIFMVAQFAEFGFGLANLVLIVLNIRNGFQLSARFKRI